MTKARLTTWIDWDPDKTGVGAGLPGPNAIEMDIEVNDGDEPITIVVTDQQISTTVRTEPRMVTVPAFPEEQLTLDLIAIDNALRNGSQMTKANIAFDRVCEHLGIDRDRFNVKCKNCDEDIEMDTENGWRHSNDGAVGCGRPFSGPGRRADPVPTKED